jgi:hypothetical protein
MGVAGVSLLSASFLLGGDTHPCAGEHPSLPRLYLVCEIKSTRLAVSFPVEVALAREGEVPRARGRPNAVGRCCIFRIQKNTSCGCGPLYASWLPRCVRSQLPLLEFVRHRVFTASLHSTACPLVSAKLTRSYRYQRNLVRVSRRDAVFWKI